MAFSNEQRTAIQQAMAAYLQEARPEPEIRSQLDIGCRIDGQSVEVFTIRPQWNDPTTIRTYAAAKATYVQATDIWKVYWMRASGKWERYAPTPTVGNIELFFKLVQEDKHACFWG